MAYLKLVQEKNIPTLIVVLTALIFLAVNFDRIFGFIFFMMVVANTLILYGYKGFKFPITGTRFKPVQVILLSIAAYGGFLLVSSFAGSFFDPSFSINGIEKVFALMSQQVPAFTGDRFLSIIAYGILVPIVETMFFFGTLFELTMNQLHTTPKANLIDNLKTPRTLLAMSVISALFALYHFTVRQTAANFDSAMVIIFIFGMISCMLVLKFRRTAEAIGMHNVANILAMLMRYGFISIVGAGAILG